MRLTHRKLSCFIGLTLPALGMVALVGWSVAVARREKATRDLIIAVSKFDATAVRAALAQGADPNARDDGNREEISGWQRIVRQVRELLHEGSRPKKPGRPVLEFAVFAGNHEIVQALLDKGADANIRTEAGESMLVVATTVGSPLVVKALLERGAQVNATDRAGRTVLMLALRQSDRNILEMVLDRHPDVNPQDKQGRTALMLAADEGDAPTVQELLALGADPNVRDSYGLTALKRADGHGYDEIVQLLRQAHALE